MFMSIYKTLSHQKSPGTKTKVEMKSENEIPTYFEILGTNKCG